ncbi:MAG: MoaD/ThiS family protein [Panacagrimonas sp.]
MIVTVSFWGITRRLAGMERREVELHEGADVHQLIDALTTGAELGSEFERCAFAVGTELVARSHVLSDGEQIAVLPPVSGG